MLNSSHTWPSATLVPGISKGIVVGLTTATTTIMIIRRFFCESAYIVLSLHAQKLLRPITLHWLLYQIVGDLWCRFDTHKW